MTNIISKAFICILHTYDQFRKKIELRKASRWLSSCMTSLKIRYFSKKPYCCEYETIPPINGDFYQKAEKGASTVHTNIILSSTKDAFMKIRLNVLTVQEEVS